MVFILEDECALCTLTTFNIPKRRVYDSGCLVAILGGRAAVRNGRADFVDRCGKAAQADHLRILNVAAVAVLPRGRHDRVVLRIDEQIKRAAVLEDRQKGHA